MSAPVTTAVIVSSSTVKSFSITNSLGLQKRFKYAWFVLKFSNTSSDLALMKIRICLLIGASTSARMLRTERMISINNVKLLIAFSLLYSGLTTGQAATAHAVFPRVII